MFALTKKYLVGLLLLLLLVSCNPSGEVATDGSVEPAADTQVQQEVLSESDQTVMLTVTPSDSDTNAASEDSVAPEVAPVAADDQTPGQTAGGMGDAVDDSGVVVDEIPEVDMNVDNWSQYVDEANNFTLAHPTDYVVRAADSATLTEATPAPLAAIRVMSPVIANSDLGDMEVPQLSIRIFNADGATSLEDWLRAQGLISDGDNVTPAQVGLATGVTACSSTLIWPNCSTFLLTAGKVYQLTAGDPVGEAMLQTFAVIQ